MLTTEKFPKIKCPYIPPEQCPSVVTEDGDLLRAPAAVMLVLSLVAAIMG